MFGWKCPKQNSHHVFWGYCGAWRFVPWGTYVITQNSPCHTDTHIHIPNEISIPAAHNIDHIHHVSHKISIISIQHGIQRQRYWYVVEVQVLQSKLWINHSTQEIYIIKNVGWSACAEITIVCGSTYTLWK